MASVVSKMPALRPLFLSSIPRKRIFFQSHFALCARVTSSPASTRAALQRTWPLDVPGVPAPLQASEGLLATSHRLDAVHNRWHEPGHHLRLHQSSLSALTTGLDFACTNNFCIFCIHFTPIVTTFTPNITGFVFADECHEFIDLWTVLGMARHG